MKLDIIPKHDDIRNCYQDIIATVSEWRGRGHELMFADAWNFNFSPLESGSEGVIGERLGVGELDILPLLKRYYGISLNIHNVSTLEEILDIVRKELNRGYPSIIQIDSFWCPSDPGYGKHHFPHYCLVVDIDDLGSKICLVDPFYMKKDVHITFEEFAKGKGICATFEFDDNFSSDVVWNEIVENAVVRVKGLNGANSIFDSMRKLAKEVLESMNLDAEVKGHEDAPLSATLVARMNDVCRSRKQFARILSYLATRYDIGELVELTGKLEHAALRWSSIQGMLVKAFYTQERTNIIKRIAAKIEEAACDEESIADELLRISSEGSRVSLSGLCGEETEDINRAEKEIIFADLSQYVNNKGFGKHEGNGPEVGLSSGYEKGFFLTDGLRNEKVWEVGEMKFNFCYPSESMNDNISCAGQVINIQEGSYTGIMLLGCSEFGNHSESVTIGYADGSTEKVPLEFTDWAAERPLFKEEIAWVGKGAVQKQTGVEIFSDSVKLFAKYRALKCKGSMVSITLPDCGNIHVFALSLLK
ncbi:MAG: BtrH N-terminal domain-containing protein [Clostridia bacterium]|nr:BtrH N-terminal domain-containing protein [Clostridia bacterium]